MIRPFHTLPVRETASAVSVSTTTLYCYRAPDVSAIDALRADIHRQLARQR